MQLAHDPPVSNILLCSCCLEGSSSRYFCFVTCVLEVQKYEQKMFLELVAIGGKLHFSLQVFIPVVKRDREC